ncbi:MAG: dihydroorotase [Gammaproteobacteria bacterium]|nr:dihydroorotase [Gammaproteobacteria bacterium]
MTDTLTLVRPDDWHLHLRDGERLAAVVGHSARQFARAIVMPNLTPPVTTVAAAQRYRERILDALPGDNDFGPLMTLYLTDETSAQEIDRAAASDHVYACKLYPAGATTNSDAGVTDIRRCDDALARMAEHGMPLLVHGEVTDDVVDIFEREAQFIDRVLAPLCERVPALRVVFEHVTTKAAVQFVESLPGRLAATITPQHLLLTRNDLLAGGLRPHHYCLPVLKTFEDRDALITAATSGSAQFFLGTDSAPHARHEKESACGCAGTYSAHAAIELYAEAFDRAGALDKLEGFASLHGPGFYRLPVNRDTITLTRQNWTVPASFPFAGNELVPLGAGTDLAWKMV